MVFRSCLCFRKYQPLTLYKLKPYHGPFKYPGILLNYPHCQQLLFRKLSTTTTTRQLEKETKLLEFQQELKLVLNKKYTTKQSRAYYRRLSKQSPEQLADFLGTTAKARGYDKDLVRVIVDAAAYWPLSTIQNVMRIWGSQFSYIQRNLLNSILLKKYAVDRDIAPIISALPISGRPTDILPFYNSALSTCLDNKEYEHVQLIISIMKERHITLDTASFNILLRMKLDKVGESDVSEFEIYQELLDNGAIINHATFNTFIKHAVQHTKWDTLEQWLDLMKEKDIKPTVVTLRILFRALCVHPNENNLSRAFDRVSALIPLSNQEIFLNTGTAALLDEKKINSAMVLLKKTFGLDAKLSIYAYNLLLRLLCQKGQIDSAQHVLMSMITSDSIPDPDIVSFTTVIHGLIRHSENIDLNQINDLYSKLLQEDLRANNVLQSVVLYGLLKSKNNSNLSKTRRLFDCIIANKNRSQIPVQNGDTALSEMNTYNMMIDFYFLHHHKSKTLKNQIPKEAFQLLNEAVETKGLLPTTVTMNIMVRGLAVLNKDLVAAEKIMDLLKSKGAKADETTIWYLAKSAYRQGQLSKAREFIDNFELPITKSGLQRLKSTLNKWDDSEKESTTTTTTTAQNL